MGLTIAESDPTPGGTWSSSVPTVGTVSTTGIVGGISVGTTVISYTGAGGCAATKTITVNSSSGVISGPNHVCLGAYDTLSDAGGGTWSSSDITKATVGSTGIVFGVATGVATITYSIGAGCQSTLPITVNPLPATITGTTNVCVSSCIPLSDAGGGTWTSSLPAIATVSGTGSVCGVSTGVTVIKYTLPLTGCFRTMSVTVNPLPPLVTVTGGGAYCAGGAGQHIGTGGSVIGVLYQLYLGGTPVGPPLAGTGGPLDFGLKTTAGVYTVIATSTINGCVRTMTGSVTISINPLPPLCTVTGGGSFCAGSAGLHVTLGCSSAGISYQLLLGGIPVGTPIAGTGGILDFGLQSAAGTYTVMATNVTTTCSQLMSGSATMTVNPLPAAIGGPTALCPGTTITCTDITPGGNWSCGPTAIGTIVAGTGVLTGIVTGTVTVTYTLPATGCSVSETVTVSPVPGPILGPSVACVGIPVTLSDIVPGGTWTSSAPGTATIGSLSGIVNGLLAGSSTTITYSLGGTSCTVTRTITVNAGPSPITGPSSVCVGNTISLSDVTTGGTWSSSLPSDGSISTTGIVTGVAGGVTTISYAVGGGCPSLHAVTVNALPLPITGPATVCVNASVTEADPSAGGTWSIAPAGAATIVAGTGYTTGLIAGPVTVTYTLPTTCQITRAITVNPLPAAMSGSAVLCVGTNTTLTEASPGGTWSHTTPSVCILSATGSTATEIGITTGTDTLTYTIPTGCSITEVLTVNSVPSLITGAGSICIGSTLTLADSVTGGTWTSVSPGIASVSPTTGVVTGVAPGTTPILYTIGSCGASVVVTVFATPVAITGPLNVCTGSTVTETDATPAGTWSSGSPLIGSVSTTGVVSGISSGTVIISYTLSTGCSSIIPVVVNPVSLILGTAIACQGQTTVLSDATPGGTWSSASPGVATVNAYSGVVTGITPGTANITYLLPTGCSATRTVTVNPIPLPVTGSTFAMCQGNSIVLTDASPLGTWGTSDAGTATVSLTGTVTGIAGGTATISYTFGTGCTATHMVTVNANPPAISGPAVVCAGGTISLSDAAPDGTWNSSAPAIASIGTTGIVTGLTPGNTTITYTLTTGCSNTTTVTVNPVLAGISGPSQVCSGATITLSDPAPGGTWSSSSATTATVDGAGNVTGGSAGIAIITYATGAGCNATQAVTVNALPGAILGSASVCQGQTVSLTDYPAPGTWTSSDGTIATIGLTTGLLSAVAPGAAVITYSVTATGCSITRTEVVNPAPAPITGTLQVCVSHTTTLSDATGGGSWSSSSPAIATADPSGTVLGMAAGNATISYTAAFGCWSTATVTVNNMPSPVSGSSTVCQGSATTYTDLVTPGVWSSSDPAIATAGATTGIITGIYPGTATITYSVGAGCSVTKNITVQLTPLPITGPSTVCATQTITLGDATVGGTWSSASPSIATVGSATGVVSGIAAGTATITYSNGCPVTHTVTVNPMPGPIAGNTNVCLGTPNLLTDPVPGGTWISSNPTIATIGSATGLVTGLVTGTSTIFYTLPAGCTVSELVHVYPLPQVFNVSGGGNYCAMGAGVHIYLSGSEVGVNYMLYCGVTATGSFAGTGSPLDFGLQTMAGTYTVIATNTATTCSISMAGSAITGIIPSVIPSLTLTASPGDTVCTGTAVSYSPVPVNGGLSPTYQWRVNGTNVGTSGTYTFIPADGDEVKATMTSNAVCPYPATASDSLKAKVYPYETPSVVISADPGDTVCKGAAVTVLPTPAYGGTAPTYTWIKNGVNSGTGSSYVFVPVNNDAVYCILQSNYLCRLNNADTSPSLTLVTDTPLTPVVTITASPGTMISAGQTLTLTASVANGGLAPTYQWVVNGIPVPGPNTNIYTTSALTGSQIADSITCQVTSHGFCPATGFKWIYISVADVSVKTVTGGGAITVIPNPNRGEFTIRGTLGSNADQEVALEITDVLGQVVYSSKLEARSGNLNSRIQLSNTIANGMYLLTLHTDAGSEVIHMVVEQ